MTDVKWGPAVAVAPLQSSSVTGCHVFRHVNAPVGMSHSAVPMFEPNVKSRSKRWKNSTYHGSAFAIASCVNAGSESTNTLWGIAAYSSRQNHDPPERLMNRSASAAYCRTASALLP